jgi:hypothetical protein
MAFTLPDNDEAFNNNQSIWMQTDINALVAGIQGDGVVSGCAPTAQGTPDMTVAVAAGTIQVSDTSYSITGGNATITAADGTNPRIDLVCAKTDDTLPVTAGTPAANPKAPDIPASQVLIAMVYVPAADTDIDSNQITDKRVFVRAVTATTQKSIQTHTVLSSETLSAAGNFDVSSIDQTYDHLLIRMILRTDASNTADGIHLYFNNDTTAANYRRILHTASSASHAVGPGNDNLIMNTSGASSTASDFSNSEIRILEYTGSKRKTVYVSNAFRRDATDGDTNHTMFNWENTAAINRITVAVDNDPTNELVSGSYLEIIGIKEETVLIVS